MSEQYDSPLVGERGSTNISDTVVATIAGRAAQEVEGAHMGGSASRAAGGIMSSITGSESQTRAEEEVRVEGEPLAEDETAELKPEEDETRGREER